MVKSLDNKSAKGPLICTQVSHGNVLYGIALSISVYCEHDSNIICIMAETRLDLGNEIANAFVSVQVLTNLCVIT